MRLPETPTNDIILTDESFLDITTNSYTESKTTIEKYYSPRRRSDNELVIGNISECYFCGVADNCEASLRELDEKIDKY